MIPGVTRKGVKKWAREGRQPVNSASPASFHREQLKLNPAEEPWDAVVYASEVPLWEPRKPEYLLTNTYPSLVEGCSWHFQPTPQRKTWGRVLVFAVSGCGDAQEWQRGCEQGTSWADPKLINISSMNEQTTECRALWASRNTNLGFKSFETERRSFRSTVSTFILYFCKI